MSNFGRWKESAGGAYFRTGGLISYKYYLLLPWALSCPKEKWAVHLEKPRQIFQQLLTCCLQPWNRTLHPSLTFRKCWGLSGCVRGPCILDVWASLAQRSLWEGRRRKRRQWGNLGEGGRNTFFFLWTFVPWEKADSLEQNSGFKKKKIFFL